MLICWGEQDFVFDRAFPAPNGSAASRTAEVHCLRRLRPLHPRGCRRRGDPPDPAPSSPPVPWRSSRHERPADQHRRPSAGDGPLASPTPLPSMCRNAGAVNSLTSPPPLPNSKPQSNRIAHALEAYGIGRGMRTVLMVTPSLEFFALTFALFKVGAVPVLIDPGMGMKNLKVCLAEAAPEAFIGIPKAHLARLPLRLGEGEPAPLLTVGRRFGWGGTTLAQLVATIPAERPYAIGRHRRRRDGRHPLHQRQHRRAEGGGLQPRQLRRPGGGAARDLRHSARRNRSADLSPLRPLRPGPGDDRRHPGDGLHPPGSRRSAKRSSPPSSTFGITTMFGSPALIDRVGRYGCEHGISLPTLRRVISAGAPVPADGAGALCHPARAGDADLHPLRRHRSAAGLLHRQQRDPRRDAPA